MVMTRKMAKARKDVSEDPLIQATMASSSSEPEQSIHGEPYLKLLLDSYQDQIKMLKEELREKNDMIFDLLNIVATHKPLQNNEPSNEPSNDTNLAPIVKPSPTTIEDSPSHSNDDNALLTWQVPKNPSKNILLSKQVESVPTNNRFSSLQDCEWLNDEEVKRSDQDMSPSQAISRKKKRGKRTVTILGDSMVKDLKQHLIQPSIPQYKIFSKSFPGAKTDDMKFYVKPSVKHAPNLIFLHSGTNDLRSKQSAAEIAENIIQLAASMKSVETEVIFSSIIRRGDAFNNKASEVNELMAKMCRERDIGYLDNSNIDYEHLQGGGKFGGIHLTERGTEIFKCNFIDMINM